MDTLNDLDNVLYEISGDAPVSSRYWQYHMIKLLEKNYGESDGVQERL
jgi:hypothetical protein